MPPHAKIFIIEDSGPLRRTLEANLERKHHQIVGTAGTRPEALEAIGRFGELAVQVVTLDGDLGSDEPGRDGEVILEAIRAQAPDVKVVGLAGNPLPGVDVDVTKERAQNEGISVLSQAITDL